MESVHWHACVRVGVPCLWGVRSCACVHVLTDMCACQRVRTRAQALSDVRAFLCGGVLTGVRAREQERLRVSACVCLFVSSCTRARVRVVALATYVSSSARAFVRALESACSYARALEDACTLVRVIASASTEVLALRGWGARVRELADVCERACPLRRVFTCSCAR